MAGNRVMVEAGLLEQRAAEGRWPPSIWPRTVSG